MTKVLEMLSDGQWHRIDEVQKKTGLGKNDVRKVVAFLRDYGFVKINDVGERIKLEEAFRKLLTQGATP